MFWWDDYASPTAEELDVMDAELERLESLRETVCSIRVEIDTECDVG